MEIHNSGHATVIIKHEGSVIYIDPFILPEKKHKADFILVTHSHFDHFDKKRIAEISTDKTRVIHHGCGISGVEMGVGDEKLFGKLKVKAVHAYNTNKKYHPKNFGVGYIMEICGKRIYHAGDTDLIPEMNSLGRIDLACLPIAGTYTMDEAEAAEAVRIIKPLAVMPIHYDSIVKGDVEKFKGLVMNSDAQFFVRKAVI